MELILNDTLPVLGSKALKITLLGLLRVHAADHFLPFYDGIPL